MEKDDELKGEGNTIDFGARTYDSRLGIWFAVDPLSDKYPNTSPYVYTANNPIMYIEKDGRDYGIYIDHKTKTITIKSTFYTVKGEASDAANTGAKVWNSENGNWQFVVGSGKDAITYDIKFDVSVKEFETDKKRDESFLKDNTGEANILKIEDVKGLGITNVSDLKIKNGGGFNEVSVVYDILSKALNTFPHEMGHTFGLDHFTKGLMAAGNVRKGSKEITLGNVSKILNNGEVGTLIESDTDKQVKSDSEIPKTSKYFKSVTHEEGTKPKNFNNGKVKKKEEKNSSKNDN